MITGGTENHLLLVDVTPWGIGGKQAEKILERIGISANKNMIPFDARSPMDPSGIRLGTPAITTRGFMEADTIKLGSMIAEALTHGEDEAVLLRLSEQVRALALAHPIYPERT